MPDVGAAGERREVALAGVAQHVDKEQAVLGGRVTDPEHQLGARVAVDVGHAELLVADDRDPGLGLSLLPISPDGTPNVASLK